MNSIIETLEKELTRAKVTQETLKSQLDSKADKIREMNKQIQDTKTVSLILTNVVGERTSLLKNKIESIVNEGLSAVFGNELSIRIDSSIKRNKTEYHIAIIHNGVDGTQESFGGGVLAVISLCLRIVAIIICGRDRVLFLDESLTFVSEQYQPKLSSFISKVCKSLNFNIILISHQPKLSQYADRVYEAYSKQGSTYFKTTEQVADVN